MPNRKRKATKGRGKTKKVKLNQNDDMACAEEQYIENYFLPVVFHNLKCYDAHFVIKHFKRRYTARPDGKNKTTDDDNMTFDDVNIIPQNGEKYLSFQVGNLRFLDSFQFLSTSLENLVSLLLKSGRNKFIHTTKHLGDHDLVFAKGVYPYSYMTDHTKFEETQLPPIEALHNTLNDEPLDLKDYQRRSRCGVILE